MVNKLQKRKLKIKKKLKPILPKILIFKIPKKFKLKFKLKKILRLKLQKRLKLGLEERPFNSNDARREDNLYFRDWVHSFDRRLRAYTPKKSEKLEYFRKVPRTPGAQGWAERSQKRWFKERDKLRDKRKNLLRWVKGRKYIRIFMKIQKNKYFGRKLLIRLDKMVRYQILNCQIKKLHKSLIKRNKTAWKNDPIPFNKHNFSEKKNFETFTWRRNTWRSFLEKLANFRQIDYNIRRKDVLYGYQHEIEPKFYQKYMSSFFQAWNIDEKRQHGAWLEHLLFPKSLYFTQIKSLMRTTKRQKDETIFLNKITRWRRRKPLQFTKKKKFYKEYMKLAHNKWNVSVKLENMFRIHQLLQKILLAAYGHIKKRQFRYIWKKKQFKKSILFPSFDTGLKCFEQRLDVILLKINFAPSIYISKLLIEMYCISVNNIIINLARFIVDTYDLIFLSIYYFYYYKNLFAKKRLSKRKKNFYWNMNIYNYAYFEKKQNAQYLVSKIILYAHQVQFIL